MTTKIVISSNRTAPVSVLKANSELVVNQNISLTTSGTAIVATGVATDRDFYINGYVTSASGYAVRFGASGLADSYSMFVISKAAKVSGTTGGAMEIMSGGLELTNHGTIEAKQTTLLVTGATTQIVNNGLITSSAGTAIKASGKKEVVINHGTTKAAGDAVVLSGSSAIFTNNGETSSTKAQALVSSGNSATLTNHGTIKSATDTVVSSGTTAKITNDGLISSSKGSAIVAKGSEAIVTISGTVKAVNDAIVLTGDKGIVTNNGTITSSAYGISVDADGATVTNNKTIKAAGGVTIDGSSNVLTNTGTITATKAGLAAVDFSGTAASQFKNSGLLESTGTAFLGGNGVQKVFNTSTIKGSIHLGGGNDYFEGLIGSVSGSVHGGKGNDTYVIGSSTIKLVEKAGEGTDLVQSSASYELEDNFENLTLLGSGNSKATGNSLANQIHGNGGNNTIKGMDGNDMLWGHGGVDILTGGSGSDTFVFAKGDGKDTITDFTATGLGHDILDLTGLSSITSFNDLVKNHMKQVGSYVSVDGLNGDTIKLENVKIAHLDAGDFLF